MTCLINGCDRPVESELTGVCCRQCLIFSQRWPELVVGHSARCCMRFAGNPVKNFGAGVGALTMLLGPGATCRWLDSFSAELHTEDYYGYEVRVTIEGTRR